jgi:transcriptional regulator with XRE-family HTH domain
MYALIILAYFLEYCFMNNTRNDKFISAFGKNLRDLRKEKGQTQEDLAYNSGLQLTQIGRIERGEINTTISTVLVLANALNVSSKDLFDFEFIEKS